jgi:hypothetical protein
MSKEIENPCQDIEDEYLLRKVIKDCFEARLKEDPAFRHKLWSAFTNVDWIVPGTDRDTGLTFRGAAYLIAEICEENDPGADVNYYCMSPVAIVDQEIAETMKKQGWDYKAYPHLDPKEIAEMLNKYRKKEEKENE